MTDLAGRVALVTGAGSGFGKATSRVLAAGGATVVATDIDLRSAEETVALIRKDGGLAEAARLDVTDREAVDRVVEDVAHRHNGAFDILVNNGILEAGTPLTDLEDEQWHGVLGINLHGPMYLSRAFVRHRQGRDQIADIVCVVSTAASEVGASAYDSAGAGHLALAEVMQAEARERDWPVRVSAITPVTPAVPVTDPWDLPSEPTMDPEIVAEMVRHAVVLPREVSLHSAVIAPRTESLARC